MAVSTLQYQHSHENSATYIFHVTELPARQFMIKDLICNILY